MDQALLLGLTLVVNLVSQGVKKLKGVNFSAKGKKVGRLVVAVFSLLAVVGGEVFLGGGVDPTALNDAVRVLLEAVLVFFGSQGTYSLAKK